MLASVMLWGLHFAFLAAMKAVVVGGEDMVALYLALYRLDGFNPIFMVRGPKSLVGFKRQIET